MRTAMMPMTTSNSTSENARRPACDECAIVTLRDTQKRLPDSTVIIGAVQLVCASGIRFRVLLWQGKCIWPPKVPPVSSLAEIKTAKLPVRIPDSTK
jgi:hypothetical protein